MEQKPIILIVDDTPENLRVLGTLLEETYEVRIATTGQSALDSVQVSTPDLILLDIMMPGMGGYEICQRLKAEPEFAMIPVIFISALGMSEQKIQAFKEGAVDYITKPFNAEEVVARVRTHIQLSKLEDLKREITERKLVEEKLRQALHEKEILIREIYHRTKNTMQVISGLLSLQASEFPENDAVQNIVVAINHRIQSISLVHQMLYETQDLSQIAIKAYIEKLADLIFHSFNVSKDLIQLRIEADNDCILLDTAIPFGMILNELMTNSLKYGFPNNRKGTINIELSKLDQDIFQLSYSDDGVGVPDGFDFRNQTTLGFSLIFGIGEEQMHGKVTMESNNGLSCCLQFNTNLYKARV